MTLDIRGRVPRGKDMEIRIQYGRGWKNMDVIDIRWFKERIVSDNGQKKVEMGATVKGIRMNIEEAKHVYHILERIMNENSKRESSEELVEIGFEEGSFEERDNNFF